MSYLYGAPCEADIDADAGREVPEEDVEEAATVTRNIERAHFRALLKAKREMMSRRNREDRETVRKSESRKCPKCGFREPPPGFGFCEQCQRESRDAILRNAARGQFPEEPF